MKLVRSWPFLTLAAVTILVGVLWHAAPADRSTGAGQAVFALVSVLGAPFIGAMRLAGKLADGSALRPLLGLSLGLAPYVIADLLLRRYRARSSAVA